MNPIIAVVCSLAVLSGWPLAPTPTLKRGFEPPSSSFTAGHRGVDLLGAPGQAVLAARAGVVVFAGRVAGRGVVVVSHGDTRTTYEPVVATVSRGRRVAQGEAVGSLELAGSHCFPEACLHWGLVRGRDYLDPLTLVGGGAVRLLPLGGGAALVAAPPPPAPTAARGPSAVVLAALERLARILRQFHPDASVAP